MNQPIVSKTFGGKHLHLSNSRSDLGHRDSDDIYTRALLCQHNGVNLTLTSRSKCARRFGYVQVIQTVSLNQR